MYPTGIYIQIYRTIHNYYSDSWQLQQFSKFQCCGRTGQIPVIITPPAALHDSVHSQTGSNHASDSATPAIPQPLGCPIEMPAGVRVSGRYRLHPSVAQFDAGAFQLRTPAAAGCVVPVHEVRDQCGSGSCGIGPGRQQRNATTPRTASGKCVGTSVDAAVNLCIIKSSY